MLLVYFINVKYKNAPTNKPTCYDMVQLRNFYFIFSVPVLNWPTVMTDPLFLLLGKNQRIASMNS